MKEIVNQLVIGLLPIFLTITVLIFVIYFILILKSKKSKSSMTCPRCGGFLIRRNSKYGSFIGCSNYPKCRYKTK